MKELEWTTPPPTPSKEKKSMEGELFKEFSELSDTEKAIVEALRNEDQTINTLADTVNIPISTLTATLFTLEMKGIIRSIAGNGFHLVKG